MFGGIRYVMFNNSWPNASTTHLTSNCAPAQLTGESRPLSYKQLDTKL